VTGVQTCALPISRGSDGRQAGKHTYEPALRMFGEVPRRVVLAQWKTAARILGGMLRVLVVEDEKRLAENVARALRENAGYAVDIAGDGEEGLYLAESSAYDLMVLDLMLPKLDGPGLLAQYRKKGHATPVLVLTARDEKENVVRLLNAGADDYMSKPFDLGEFLARAKALVRRGKGQRSPVISVADLQLNTIERTVRRGQKEIALVPMEYRVLEYLAHRPRAVVSKSELLEHLYDYNWEKFSNVIEVYISGLRSKIDSTHPVKLIHTVRGHGYVLRPERN
jgi:DNA-binding response OmpR family regulator